MHSQDPRDQHFREDDQVLVWYPPQDTNDQDRDMWSWLPGTIPTRCGPDEWLVLVEVPNLAEPDPTIPNGDAPENLLYPPCFRDATELQTATAHDWDKAYREWSR